MDGWLDGWMNEWMKWNEWNKWMDEWMNDMNDMNEWYYYNVNEWVINYGFEWNEMNWN